jgi:hypothetical protein
MEALLTLTDSNRRYCTENSPPSSPVFSTRAALLAALEREEPTMVIPFPFPKDIQLEEAREAIQADPSFFKETVHDFVAFSYAEDSETGGFFVDKAKEVFTTFHPQKAANPAQQRIYSVLQYI